MPGHGLVFPATRLRAHPVECPEQHKQLVADQTNRNACQLESGPYFRHALEQVQDCIRSTLHDLWSREFRHPLGEKCLYAASREAKYALRHAAASTEPSHPAVHATHQTVAACAKASANATPLPQLLAQVPVKIGFRTLRQPTLER